MKVLGQDKEGNRILHVTPSEYARLREIYDIENDDTVMRFCEHCQRYTNDYFTAKCAICGLTLAEAKRAR